MKAADSTSGIASAEVEMRRNADTAWHALPVERKDEGFTAVIDDEKLPKGTYRLRARVRDQSYTQKLWMGLKRRAAYLPG